MKRTILALAVAVVAVSVGVAAAIVSAHHDAAPAATASSAPKTAPMQVLRFVSKDSSENYVDAKPAGLSAGDTLAQHSTWYQGGANVGHMAVTATVTLRRTAQTGEVMFTAVASLEGGDVVMTGRFDVVPQNQTYQGAITGGTGTYANARGYAVFTQVSANATKVALYLSK